jgi:CBS domain-containing protein
MKVHEIMTTAPETCGPETNLAAAVERMWRADCGALPVMTAEAALVGIITDRDMCIALGTRNQPASAIPVASVMTRDVATCRTDEEVDAALARMTERRVRRLPVVDDAATLVGVLSLDDIVLASGAKAVKPAAVLQALKKICAPKLPVVRVGRADAA